jgi:flavodoxin
MKRPTGSFGIAPAAPLSLGSAAVECGMADPKTLLICASVHHHNTALVARRLADVLGGDVRSPAEVSASSLADYDLVGFGSGVYYGRFHESLWEWVRGLPDKNLDQGLDRKSAFVFSTSGLSCLWKLWHGPFTKELARKGFDVVGEFHCRGFDSWGPLWLTGGINRRHPDDRDLERAAEFARRVKGAVVSGNPT